VRFDDWMLALHVLSAFSLVAGLVLFWALIVVGRRIDTPQATLSLGPVARVGTATVGVGMVGTIVFGLWLAFSVRNYDIWDAWIIIAIVLWFVGSGAGGRLGAAVRDGTPVQAVAGSRRMVAVMAVATLLLLLDMIFKPWA